MRSPSPIVCEALAYAIVSFLAALVIVNAHYGPSDGPSRLVVAEGR